MDSRYTLEQFSKKARRAFEAADACTDGFLCCPDISCTANSMTAILGSHKKNNMTTKFLVQELRDDNIRPDDIKIGFNPGGLLCLTLLL